MSSLNSMYYCAVLWTTLNRRSLSFKLKKLLKAQKGSKLWSTDNVVPLFSLTLTTSAAFHVYCMHYISIIVNIILGNIYLKYTVSNVEILGQAPVPLVRLLHERQQNVFTTIFRRIFSMNRDPKLWISPETVWRTTRKKKVCLHYMNSQIIAMWLNYHY